MNILYLEIFLKTLKFLGKSNSDMEIIKFYKVNDPYGEFSNFASSPIVLEAQVWQTVEHYFQASKFEDFRIGDAIRLMKSPMDAAMEGRNRANKLKSNWEEIKNGVMYKGLTAKFKQNPKLKKLLLETANMTIIEHTANDSYWADGGDGSGTNMLGILLMRVREELRTISELPGLIFPPWIAFPSTERYDMFWRMGFGENYLDNWYKYIDVYGMERYKLDFPEPNEWQGTY